MMMFRSTFNGQWDLKIILFPRLLLILVLLVVNNLDNVYSQTENLSYQGLLTNFESPDFSLWGEVPLWWWEADSISKERITWELETLAAKGVKSVCPIQRSPARTYPESFSEKWWDMFEYTHNECKRLGMSLWLYDQVGYGQYGWLEKAAAQQGNADTYKVEFYTETSVLNSNGKVEIQIGKGEVLGARAYPVVNNIAVDEKSIDVLYAVKEGKFSWDAPTSEEWKVAIMILEPYTSFYLNEAATDAFIQLLYERIEKTVGRDALGKSFVGIFQDEHPATPRDLYTEELADTFKVMFGYDIERAIPALYFGVGNKTPMYRNNYFDAYLAIVEKTYWKKIYDWAAERNLLTSHDNWGRLNIYNHSQGYIDYFRTQRWFTAPGYDDWGQNTIENRNYYDTKIASGYFGSFCASDFGLIVPVISVQIEPLT